MQFTPQNLKLIKADIDKALTEVCSKYGIDIQLGRASYDANTFKLPLEATVKGKDSRELSDLKRALTAYGYDAERAVKIRLPRGDKHYLMVGIARTKVSVVEEGTDARFRLDLADVLRFLSTQQPSLKVS